MPDASSFFAGLVLAADAAPAGDAPTSAGPDLVGMLPVFAVIFFIFYFLVIRPQGKERKKREDLLKQVKKHDKVVTTAGIHGVVVSTTDAEIVLEVSDGVRIKFDRAAIWQVKGDETTPAVPPEAALKAPEVARNGKGKS